MLLIRVIAVTVALFGLAECHLRFTNPPARKYAIDFLDNARTESPCGMEYKDGYPITTLKTGDITVNWHVAYPHVGGVKFDILNAQNEVIHNLTSDYLYLDDATKLSHTLNLDLSMVCDHCILRIIRQAGEWTVGNGDPRGYIFWSCADVKIVDATDVCYENRCLNGGTCDSTADKCTCTGTYDGDRCQYKNDCNTNADCNDNGECVDTGNTYYPKKVCYCNAGKMGTLCNLESSISDGEVPSDEMEDYVKVTLYQDPLFELMYKIDDDEVEFAVKIATNTWGAVGFRPDTTTATCRNFPTHQTGTVTTPEPEVTTPEPETTAEPATTAAPSRRKRNVESLNNVHSSRSDYFHMRYKRETGTNVIKQLCENNDTALALQWAAWNYNGGTGTPPQPEGEGTAAPEGEGTAAPEGEGEGHGSTAAPEGEGEVTSAPEGEGEGTAEPEGEGEGNGGPLHAMDCTDIAFFAAIGNRHRVMDMYTRDRGTPVMDELLGGSFSFTGAAAKIVDGMLYARVSRKMSSSDPADHGHGDQNIRFIWARGQNPTNFYHFPASGLENCKASDYDYYRTNELKYHGTNVIQRGTAQINIYEDPNATPEQTQDGMFSFPNLCEGANCVYSGTYKYRDSAKEIDITIKANVADDQWAGIAFSRDMFMVQSDAILGWMDGATGVVSDRWLSTKTTGSGQLADANQDFVSRSAMRVDGMLEFTFTRKVDLKDDDDLELLDDECFLMLHAWGGTVIGGVPGHHTKWEKGSRVCLESHGVVAKISSLSMLVSVLLVYCSSL